MAAESQPVMIACSVFRPEIEALQAAGRLCLPTRYLDSALHMRPDALATALDEVIGQERSAGHRCLLCYGDCEPDMHRRREAGCVLRPAVPNCVAMLVGRERRRAWITARCFVLLPEWAARWRSLLMRLPGLDVEQTRSLFRDQHRSLVYADTGVRPVPAAALADCAAHFDLPLQIEAVGIEVLATHLERCLEEAGDAP